MGIDPNKKSEHPAVLRMQKKQFWQKVKRRLMLVAFLGLVGGGWAGMKKYRGEEVSWEALWADIFGGASEAIALLDEEMKRGPTPSDEELSKMLRKTPPPADAGGGAAPAAGTGTTPDPDAGGKPAGTPPSGGTQVSTVATPEPTAEEKAAQAKVKDANTAYDSCMAHYEKFRSTQDRGKKGIEIKAAMSNIQKAAAGYASALDILPDNAWLQERHRKSIEILKECRYKAELFK
ncbi:MAG: hypothetical protein HYZ53_21140 [Planctomycetes bacterium]|nr:hypothetical protein [Planctomycetota bacterium]